MSRTQQNTAVESERGVGETLLDFFGNAGNEMIEPPEANERERTHLNINAGLERLGVRSETISQTRGFLREVMSEVDPIDIAKFAVSGVALLGGYTETITSDQVSQEKLRKLGYGAAALGLYGLVPEKYRGGTLGKAALLGAFTYWFGRDGWNILKGATRMITSPVESVRRLWNNPGEVLAEMGLAERREEATTPAETTESHTDERAEANEEEPEIDEETEGQYRLKRRRLIRQLSRHREGNELLAQVMVRDMTDGSIEIILEHYRELKLANKINTSNTIRDVLEKIYKKVEEQAERRIEETTPWHQKGLFKGAREATSLVFSCIPVVGNVYTGYMFFSGDDLIGGDKLSTTERAIVGAATFLPGSGLFKAAGKGLLRIFKGGKVAIALKAGRAATTAVPKYAMGMRRFDKLVKHHKAAKAAARKFGTGSPKHLQAKAKFETLATRMESKGFDRAVLNKAVVVGAPVATAEKIVHVTDIFRSDDTLRGVQETVVLGELERALGLEERYSEGKLEIAETA